MQCHGSQPGVEPPGLRPSSSECQPRAAQTRAAPARARDTDWGPSLGRRVHRGWDGPWSWQLYVHGGAAPGSRGSLLRDCRSRSLPVPATRLLRRGEERGGAGGGGAGAGVGGAAARAARAPFPHGLRRSARPCWARLDEGEAAKAQHAVSGLVRHRVPSPQRGALPPHGVSRGVPLVPQWNVCLAPRGTGKLGSQLERCQAFAGNAVIAHCSAQLPNCPHFVHRHLWNLAPRALLQGVTDSTSSYAVSDSTCRLP